MAIIEKIHNLTKALTGEDGVGHDITSSINDLTTKWTGTPGTGVSIDDAIACLAENAEGGSGGSAVCEKGVYVLESDITVNNKNPLIISFNEEHETAPNFVCLSLEAFPQYAVDIPSDTIVNYMLIDYGSIMGFDYYLDTSADRRCGEYQLERKRPSSIDSSSYTLCRVSASLKPAVSEYITNTGFKVYNKNNDITIHANRYAWAAYWL